MTVGSNIKQTITTIKGIEAQLSTLALNSLDKSAQQTFHETMLTIQDVEKDLQARFAKIQLEESEYKGS